MSFLDESLKPLRIPATAVGGKQHFCKAFLVIGLHGFIFDLPRRIGTTKLLARPCWLRDTFELIQYFYCPRLAWESLRKLIWPSDATRFDHASLEFLRDHNDNIIEERRRACFDGHLCRLLNNNRKQLVCLSEWIETNRSRNSNANYHMDGHQYTCVVVFGFVNVWFRMWRRIQQKRKQPSDDLNAFQSMLLSLSVVGIGGTQIELHTLRRCLTPGQRVDTISPHPESTHVIVIELGPPKDRSHRGLAIRFLFLFLFGRITQGFAHCWLRLRIAGKKPL